MSVLVLSLDNFETLDDDDGGGVDVYVECVAAEAKTEIKIEQRIVLMIISTIS